MQGTKQEKGADTDQKQFFLRSSLVALTVLLLESGIAFAWFERALSLPACLFAHLLLGLGLLPWIWFWRKKGHDLKLLLLVLILTMAIGPFGSFIAFFAVFFYAFFSRSSTPFLEWLASLFPEEKMEESVGLYQRLSTGRDDFSDKRGIMTFVDIMAMGTVQQKREALGKISRYYRKEFAPALTKALHDSSNAIRVQAATVVAKIEQDFMSTYLSLSRAYRERPDDADLLLRLAEQADAYAYSDILDRERKQEFHDKAIEYYEAYFKKRPNDLEIRFSLGRLYIRSGNPEKNSELLKEAVENDGYKSANLGMWFMESLFYMGRYREIGDIAEKYLSKLGDEAEYSFRVLDTLRLWKEGIPEENLEIR